MTVRLAAESIRTHAGRAPGRLLGSCIIMPTTSRRMAVLCKRPSRNSFSTQFSSPWKKLEGREGSMCALSSCGMPLATCSSIYADRPPVSTKVVVPHGDTACPEHLQELLGVAGAGTAGQAAQGHHQRVGGTGEVPHSRR